MSRPRILDLCCKAGGAAEGYHRAGFEVVGVDIEPQPNYPFEFRQADALTFPLDGFDAIHASPPCQLYTAGAARWKTTTRHLDLIPPVRARLLATGVPFVIENVVTAPLLDPVVLCGCMFGLGVFRHRGFELSWACDGPAHLVHDGRIGDGRYFTITGHSGGSSKRDDWIGGTKGDWQKAMDIDWMTTREMAQAIPPPYTEWIGSQLLAHLT